MGPYSEERQAHRARSVQRILEQDLPEDTRRLWRQVLQGLARSESQYNARVRALFEPLKRKGLIDYGCE